MSAPITTDLVWTEIEKRSFAVLSYVNPKGQARSAGIVYVAKDRVLYIGTGKDSWKAKHIRLNPHVALNVTIPKRIPFLPWIQIPHATIALSGTARVRPVSDAEPEVVETLMRGMTDQQAIIDESCMLEIRPTGHFATYGVGVPLMDMRDPEKAQGRAPVFAFCATSPGSVTTYRDSGYGTGTTYLMGIGGDAARRRARRWLWGLVGDRVGR